MRRVALTFFFLILGATVSFCQAAAQQRTVGVISTIGETFTLQKVGIMVFGNESNDAAIDSWGIDDLVSKKVAALLSGRFAVKKINTSKGAFAYLERPGFDPFSRPRWGVSRAGPKDRHQSGVRSRCRDQESGEPVRHHQSDGERFGNGNAVEPDGQSPSLRAVRHFRLRRTHIRSASRTARVYRAKHTLCRNYWPASRSLGIRLANGPSGSEPTNSVRHVATPGSESGCDHSRVV